MRNLRHKLKIWTYNKPSLYASYYQLIGKEKRLLINNNTALVIEGFPRSANTFSIAVLNEFIKDSTHIAHHLHNPSQILLGIKQKISCVVLVREPSDAVISYSIRNQISLEMGLLDYIKFYEVLLPYANNLIVFDFKKITSAPENFVLKIFQTNPSIFKKEPDSKIDQEEIFNRMERFSMNNFNKVSETEVARPSKQRKIIKEKFLNLIYSEKYQPLLRRAKSVYLKFHEIGL